jgi:hypothetical protein
MIDVHFLVGWKRAELGKGIPLQSFGLSPAVCALPVPQG